LAWKRRKKGKIVKEDKQHTLELTYIVHCDKRHTLELTYIN